MVSYATPGGGVGPHIDRYDVFPLQGPDGGCGAFKANGIWRTPATCSTCRRACATTAWRSTMLHLLDRLSRAARRGARRCLPRLAARARSAGRGLPRCRPAAGARPGEVPKAMVRFADALLARIRWSRSDVERFVGEYLSEPKPHVVFPAPAAGGGLARLDRAPRCEDAAALPRPPVLHQRRELDRAAARAGLRELADRRIADGARLPGRLAGLISRWQRLGYAHLEKKKDGRADL